MNVRPATPEDASGWNAFLAAQPHSTHFQRFEWGPIFETSFKVGTFPLLAEEGGEICGVLPLFHVPRYLVVGGFLSSFPGGVCAPSEDISNQLLEKAWEICLSTDSSYLVLRDQSRERTYPNLQTRLERTYVVRQLSGDASEFWEERASKFRRQVRRAEGSLTVSWDPKRLTEFFPVFSCNMRDLGTPVFTPRFFELAGQAFGDSFRLATVLREERVVGGMILLDHGGELHNPFVSSLRDYFDMRPNDLLYWEAIRLACQLGRSRLDLGRSAKGSGHARFKKKFSARKEPLYYQYLLNKTDQIPAARGGRIYPLFRVLWQRCPLPIASRIGPFLRRAIPLG